MSRNKITEEDLRGIEGLPLTGALDRALSLIERMTFKKKDVQNHLINDVKRAKDFAEVSRILWYTYLSGNGLGVIGSKWGQNYYGKGKR